MISPGALNWQLTVQTRSKVRGSAGGVAVSWVNGESLAAEKVSEHTREFRSAKERHAQVQLVFRIWYYEGLSARDNRFLYGSESLEILGTSEEVRGVSMLVSCRYTEGKP